MGTLDLLVVKIASAQPVCLIICGKEARLKRHLKGKNELRKIGNKACAILIVIEKGTCLLNLGHFSISYTLIKPVSPKLSDVRSLLPVKPIWWAVNIKMVFLVITSLKIENRKIITQYLQTPKTVKGSLFLSPQEELGVMVEGVWDDRRKWI